MLLFVTPAILFVYGFVGSEAMNLLRGTLRLGAGWRLV
jgi:ABC-type sugar transport system ATPase subunit